MADDEFLAALKAFEGREIGGLVGPDAVNQAMIRHWVQAMGDTNPVYTDPEAAAASVHGEIDRPAVMLQAWTMQGLVRGRRPVGQRARTSRTSLLNLVESAGFTSVVATNCEQEYDRMLHIGDHLHDAQRHRVGLGGEADGSRRRPLHHDAHRVPHDRRRAGRPAAVPHPEVQARHRAQGRGRRAGAAAEADCRTPRPPSGRARGSRTTTASSSRARRSTGC